MFSSALQQEEIMFSLKCRQATTAHPRFPGQSLQSDRLPVDLEEGKGEVKERANKDVDTAEHVDLLAPKRINYDWSLWQQ